MFRNPFYNAFGLDINDQSIKLVQLANHSAGKKHPMYAYKLHKEIRLPEGLIVDGELTQPGVVQKYVYHILQGNGPKKERVYGNWAVVSVPAVQGFLRHLLIDKPSSDILEEDVFISAERHIPFTPEEYYLDWQIVGESDNSTDILIGAIPRNIADAYTQLLESIGLGVIALEIEDLAVARAMITHGKTYEGEARAILDLGANRSSLIIYDQNIVQFSMGLDFCGADLIHKIATAFSLSVKDAEEQLHTHGATYTRTKTKLFSLISAEIDVLVAEIQKAIHFYLTHFKNPNQITHITMCGGVSNMIQLDQILSKKLGIGATKGDVWKNLYHTENIPSDQNGHLEFASAIGLALRAADNPFLIRDTI